FSSRRRHTRCLSDWSSDVCSSDLGILDTLLEAGWIRPKGHKQTPGRPATWVTTQEFLVHFGLDGLADLPGVDELKAAGLLDPRRSEERRGGKEGRRGGASEEGRRR